MEQNKIRRNRRTNASIDNDIMDAAKKVIEKVGFSNATLNAIIQEASIEPNTFYRRFEDLDSLFDLFVQKYDYFLGNMVDIQFDKENYTDFYRNYIIELAKQLYVNKSLQKIMVWELSDDNKITRRTARLREEQSKKILKRLQDYFADTGFDISIFAALLIGGIYYLILHKDRSTFCGIDFSTQEGKKRLIKAVENIIQNFFNLVHLDNKVLEIATNMKKEKISNDLISKVTGMPIEIIDSL
jgi:AcrR family transcriptional regulator